MASTKKIQELIEKTKHYDADERYMAATDLIREVSKTPGTLEASLQEPIRKVVLQQLEDKGKDISTIAVKSLSTWVEKLNSDQIVAIGDKMGEMVVDPEKGDTRDIYADGLTTLILALDEKSGKIIAPKLAKNLLKGLTVKPKPDDVSLELACMDLTAQLVEKFPNELAETLPAIMKALENLLAHPNDAARKRASVTLGPIVPVLDEAQFKSLMELVLKQIQKPKPEVYIQTVGVASKAAGVRVGEYLSQVVPLLLGFLKKESKTVDETIELWTNCLQAFEALVLRCPNKVTPFVPDIIRTALDKLRYDPNLAKDEGAHGGGGGGGGEEGWGDGGDDGGWGDDAGGGGGGWDIPDEVPETSGGDESWKVRRAAVGVISAFVRIRTDILSQYFADICSCLVSKFGERDASVQEEVFLALKDLVHTSVIPQHDLEDEEDLPKPTLIRTRSTFETLDSQTQVIFDKMDVEFKKTGLLVQKAMFGAWAELVTVHSGRVAKFYNKLFPHIFVGIEATGKNAVLNGDALALAGRVVDLAGNNPEDLAQLKPFLQPLALAAAKAVEQAESRVKSDALYVVGSVARAAKGQDAGKIVDVLYGSTLNMVVQKDAPQNIKVASINTMAVVLSSHGEALAKQLPTVLPVLAERLNNEVSQQPALRAIADIASSGLKLDLTIITNAAIEEVALFMRKNNQKLRHEAVNCLTALIRTHGEKIKPKDFAALLTEMVPHIADSDLQLTALVLGLLSATLQAAPANAPQIAKDLLPVALKFVRSPLLQGQALEALISFFQHSVVAGAKEKALAFARLLEALLKSIDPTLPRVNFLPLAKCIAAITKKVGGKDMADTINKLISDVKGAKTPDDVREIALLALGEIGSETNLEAYSIDSVVVSAFASKEDGVRKAAAFALGSAAAGNMQKFLPVLLRMLKDAKDDSYLVLCALRDNIASHLSRPQVFLPFVRDVTPLLLQYAKAKDDGARNTVAECLGRLAQIDPAQIQELDKLVKDQIPAARCVAMTAFRYSFAKTTTSSIWYAVGEKLDFFLALLEDQDLEVRRETVLTVNALARANFGIIRKELLSDKILPALYRETQPNKALIREVDYGSFKATIDDGLPLRKSAFQTLSTILDVGFERLDMQKYISVTRQGLVDQEDIQMATFNMYEHIARLHPSVVLEILDTLPDAIMSSLKEHIKNSKGADNQKALDCLRIILKALLSFNKLPGVESCKKYSHFWKQVCATAVLQPIIKDLQPGGPGPSATPSPSPSPAPK